MDKTKPIAILSNPSAGRGGSVQVVKVITRLLDAKQITYSVFHEQWPTDYLGFTSVWIVGGDGTLNYFINHYPVGKIPMAIFKAGTGNDFANFLYGDASPEGMIEIILNATPREIDAGICNGLFYLNTVGIGFDGKVLEQMNTVRWMGSFLGYYTAIIRNIFTFKELAYSIKYDDQAYLQGKFLLILVSNSPTTGGGFKVSPLARPDDGVLDLITCRPLTVLKRLFSLPAIREGRHLGFDFIRHTLIKELLIECASPVPAQVDGELIVANSFTCKILPGHFNFLY